MAEIDPNAFVDARGLLAVTPGRVVDGYYTRLQPDGIGYIGQVRDALRYSSGREITLDELPEGHGPDSGWDLTPEGEAQVAAETETFLAGSNFTEETAALAAAAFPDNSELQTTAAQNATSVLHHAAHGFLVLPRRQIYREFARERAAVLRLRIGELATSQLLAGGQPQVRMDKYMLAYSDLRSARPHRGLVDLTTVPQTESSPLVQQIVGDAAVLARLLLRHAPQYLVSQETWPQGAAGLARRALEENPLDLWQALVDAPEAPAEALVSHYLGNENKSLGGYMLQYNNGQVYNPDHHRNYERGQIQDIRDRLSELLGHEDVHAELLEASIGDVIELTAAGETVSKAVLDRVLNNNIRALAYAQFLDSVGLREATRSRMPDFSEGWRNGATNPARILLGNHYGNVRNLRIAVLPVDETLGATRYKRASQIDFSRLVRLAVLVDCHSSSARASLANVLEVTVYPNHTGTRDIITRETHKTTKKGEEGLQNLWDDSVLRAHILEGQMMSRAFQGGSPGSGSGRGNRRGGSRN